MTGLFVSKRESKSFKKAAAEQESKRGVLLSLGAWHCSGWLGPSTEHEHRAPARSDGECSECGAETAWKMSVGSTARGPHPVTLAGTQAGPPGPSLCFLASVAHALQRGGGPVAAPLLSSVVAKSQASILEPGF